LEYYRILVESFKLKIKYKSKVANIEKHGSFLIVTKDFKYTSDFLIIATGYYDNPRKLNVPGEDLEKVTHYYDDAHRYIGQKVLVVGAANSACDVALETWQKGAEVTMVVRNAELYKKVKYWILPNIENRIKEGSIKAYFNSTLKSISENTVKINTPEGLVEIENDYVLAMTGYKPDFNFLAAAGIEFEENENRLPKFDPVTLESNVGKLYLAGVINSGMLTSKLFIENTREHGKMIIKDILSKKESKTGA